MTALHVFDMDGTLLRGSTASLEVSRALGCTAELEHLEARFAAGTVSAAAFAVATHALWGDLTAPVLAAAVAAAPWIDGIDDVFADIDARGEHSMVITLSPDLFAGSLSARGAHRVCASGWPPLPLRTAIDPSAILRPSDKVRLVRDEIARLRLTPAACVAYGDSRSDGPLFAAVANTVAVNADDELTAAARVAYRGGDLRDAYRLGRELLIRQDEVPVAQRAAYAPGMPHPTHHHHHAHDAFDDADLADLLDLDAGIVAPHLDEILGRVAALAPAGARTVVDLGAGTGTGSAALGRWFPEATVVAVDGSAGMVERLRALPGVTAVHADLDAGWPDVGAPDVVWAASSLHHLGDPERVLRDAHAAMPPGALLAAVELDGQPRVLNDDAGRTLEDRCHEHTSSSGWNAHPDWAPVLERAGFAMVEHRRYAFDVVPDPAVGVRYARAVLARVRAGVGDRLTPADRDALDALLADGALEHRGVRVRGSRTAWLARVQRTS